MGFGKTKKPLIILTNKEYSLGDECGYRFFQRNS